MATSYAALEREHRELLLAMLDSPPGPVAERDLAAALRRHTDERLPEGAGRPRRPARRPLPAGDRMRVDWVHPSWRDLVIDVAGANADERRRFLSRCGVDGAAVALSSEGGSAGERERPLLQGDADWDALGDGLHHLCAELDEAEAIRLLHVLAEAGDDAEVRALAALVLKRLGWSGKAVSVDAIGAWAAVSANLDPRPEPPAVAMTWLELEPSHAPETPEELERMADWLRLAELLTEHDAGADRGPRASRSATRRCWRPSRPTRRATSRVLERELRIESLARLAALDEALSGRGAERVAGAHLRGGRAVPDGMPTANGFPIERVLRDL